MAALSLTTGIKDKVAFRLYSQAYASLTGTNAYQASLIDGEGASALTELSVLGQYFYLAGGAASAPDAFEPAYVALIALRVAQNAYPERLASYEKEYNRSLRTCMSAFNRQALDYAPTGAAAEAFVYSLLSIRNYVLSHAVRLTPPLMPDVMTVDGAVHEVMTNVWNRAGWRFRRRPVLMTVTRTAFTGGTYSESGKAITVGSAPFTANSSAGGRVYVTGGTGATVGEMPLTSNTTTVLTMPSSIGSAADGQTDIAGFVVVVSFTGLETGETFDSIASVRWYYADQGHEGETLTWLDADEFSRARSLDATTTRRPWFFRNQTIGPATGWQFSPPPDASYTVRGEVLVTTPAAPTAAGDGSATAAPFTRFATELLPFVRSAVLDRVLMNYGKTNEVLHEAVADEMESRFAIYQDAGAPEQRGGTSDVYNDLDHMQGAGGNMLGGAM